MRRQLSTYIDPEHHPADRKLARILRREARGKRSMSRAIYDALMEYYGLAAEPGVTPTLPGMENVYPGRVVAQRGGLATVQVGDRRVYSASTLPPRTRVFVSIRGHSIVVQTSAPSGNSSMRNALPARVRRVLELEEIAYVDLLSGSLSIRALVTPTSVRKLGLRPGSEVTLAFKAISVKLTPR
jgi:molybdopterin-binding protein